MTNLTFLENPVLINKDGSLLGRFHLIQADDGVAGISFNHLVRVEPHDEVAGVIEHVLSHVSAHFQRGVEGHDGVTRQFPAISDGAAQKFKDAAATAWTPEVQTDWRDRRAAAQAEAEEHEQHLQQVEAEAEAKRLKDAAGLQAMIDEGIRRGIERAMAGRKTTSTAP